VLVRHGLSSFNLEHRIQGRDDLSTLTEAGVAQARATGAALRELTFTAAYASPLSRAAETARHLLAEQGGAMDVRFDDDLLEVDLAPWSGLLSREVHERFPEQAHQWLHSPADLELERADGSRYRPIPELLSQSGRFVDGLLDRHSSEVAAEGTAVGTTVLVVAHNAILRCLLLHLLGRSANELRRLRVDNASISVLNLERSAEGALQVQIESLNGTGHLGAGLPPKGPGQRLLLVRHGETDWNRQGRFQGQIDIPLNANGWAQAEAASRFLEPVAFQRAYTSSMARPRQTAEVILKAHPGVPLTSVPALVEIGHGLWEGRLEQEIAEGWPALLADWKRAPHTVQMPEGENLQQVWDRSLLAWNRIVAGLDPSETALVIAHDAVNKTILCALLGLAPADIWAVKQGNGGVTVIDYPQGPEGLPLVAALNLTAHLGGVIDRTAAGAL
jgi:probable phosphoglycerate mutase